MMLKPQLYVVAAITTTNIIYKFYLLKKLTKKIKKLYYLYDFKIVL